MLDNFLEFIKNPTAENFSLAQGDLFKHEAYDPYSTDLDKLDEYLNKQDYQSTLSLKNLNFLLSPRAHMMKSFAHHKLNDKNAADAENLIYLRLIEGFKSTGDGSEEKPFIVCRISDERDILESLGEMVMNQRLVQSGDRSLDVLTTLSEKKYWFDITVCYQKLQQKISKPGKNPLDDLLETIEEENNTGTTKKPWWKFWK